MESGMHYTIGPLRPGDEIRMLEWMKDPQSLRYLSMEGAAMTLEQSRSFVAKAEDMTRNAHFAIRDDQSRYCGTISLKNIDAERSEAEYAIVLHPDTVGKGAAYSASTQLLAYAAQRGLHRVYLNVIRENQRAVRLYEKLGFRYIRTTEAQIRGRQTTLLWYEKRIGSPDDKKERG